MGHSLKDCHLVSEEVKILPNDELPYFVALKAKSTFLGKVNLKLRNKGKKSMS